MSEESDLTCRTCGRTLPSPEALERHLEGHARHGPSAASPDLDREIDAALAAPKRREGGLVSRIFSGLLAAVFFIFGGFWRFILVLVVVGAILDAFGVFDREKVEGNPGDPGYSLLVRAEDQGGIDSFQPVEPDDGWDYEYEINDDSDFVVRFRRSGSGIEMEAEGYGYETDAWSAIREQAQAAGYKSQN